MEPISQNNHPIFNETEWIKLVFLLSDTTFWLEDLIAGVFQQLPISNKKKLFKHTFHLSITAMAHIIERHYHKVQRHPSTGKFTIPLTEVLAHIRDSSMIQAFPIDGSENLQRLLDRENYVGFDRNGVSTSKLTVITDNNGNVITAFPGTLK